MMSGLMSKGIRNLTFAGGDTFLEVPIINNPWRLISIATTVYNPSGTYEAVLWFRVQFGGVAQVANVPSLVIPVSTNCKINFGKFGTVWSVIPNNNNPGFQWQCVPIDTSIVYDSKFQIKLDSDAGLNVGETNLLIEDFEALDLEVDNEES